MVIALQIFFQNEKFRNQVRPKNNFPYSTNKISLTLETITRSINIRTLFAL